MNEHAQTPSADAPDAGPRRRPWAHAVALSLAVALPIALRRTEFHVVPTADGTWRGLAEAPAAGLILSALACGAALAWLLRRQPAHISRPLLLLALAGAPLIPVSSGGLPALLGLQRPLLTLVMAGALAVCVARLAARLRVLRRPSLDGPVGALALFALAFAYFALLGRFLPGPAGPQGDEPHYLLQAQSLLSDGDLDLTDEYDQREYRPFFPGTLLAHTSPRSPRGVLYEVHTPGLPVLLLPAYALGGYPGAKLFLALVAALTALLVQRVARAATGSEGAALFAWATLVLVPPLPVYAQAIYPELPAALASAVFLWAARCDARWSSLLAAGFAAAALPWLHPKFLPLALVGLALAALRPGRARAVRICALTLFAVSCLGLLFFFQALYGEASLSAAYGPRFASDVALTRLPWGLPALFLDRQFGLLTLAPVWALAAPGLAALAARRPGDTLRGLLLAGATLAVGASFSMWWGGACPPGRFVVPALPVLALGLAPVFHLHRQAALALTAAGATLTLLAAETPRALHNRADGESGLLRFLVPSLDLDGWLPSFVVPGAEAPLLGVTLLALLALAWARGGRGLMAGALAYALVAASTVRAPLVDPQASVARLLDAWDHEILRPVSGPLELSSLALPLDLPRAPWTLRRGDEMRTRRVALPPGLYRLEIAARPGPTRSAIHLTRLEAQNDELSLDWTYLRVDRPVAPLTLLLPGGAPRFVLAASGVADEGLVEGARLVPLALVPRRRREEFRFPLVLSSERYRVGDERLRVTAVDRSQPEERGFRLDGAWGQFLLETPAGASVRVRVRRDVVTSTDVVLWQRREIALPAELDTTLTLPVEGAARLGDVDVLPVGLEAEGAWIGFEPVAPG